mmetsp:Transcript_29730/g.45324  ORF Transcript_29730/g.45324 Transcript_29730/m.45324 type:complete len:201 (-) Transcript_29730:439-1041(-)
MDLLLENKGSQSNCFINSVLQLFWNIDWFFSCIDAHYSNRDQREYDFEKETKEARLVSTIAEFFGMASKKGESLSKYRRYENAQVTMKITKIRIELFKSTYACVANEKFMPYVFGDSNEVLDTFLNSIHHTLNASLDKQKSEDPCFNREEKSTATSNFSCTAHHACFLNLSFSKICECSPNKEKKQRFSQNTFFHFIDAT